MLKWLVYILPVLLAACSHAPYQLADNGKDKNYLIRYIANLEKKGEMTDRPLLIIDGFVHTYEELKEGPIPLRREDISQVDHLGIGSEAAINIYGEMGREGVLLVRTRRSENASDQSADESHVLILVGNRPVSPQELDQIDPDDIEEIEVIKNQREIKKYTEEDYDGVVIIRMKKSTGQ